MTFADELARCYVEQRDAAAALAAAGSDERDRRDATLWLADWVAEEALLRLEER